MTDFNANVIEEFRSNDGKVGGPFAGAPILLLHHRGAKSGAERVNPLMYQQVGSSYAVFASKGGAPDNPDWYHNLKANPVTTVEIGAATVPVTAREASPEEREPIWDRQKKEYPGFADYEKATRRTIPVVILDPAT